MIAIRRGDIKRIARAILNVAHPDDTPGLRVMHGKEIADWYRGKPPPALRDVRPENRPYSELHAEIMKFPSTLNAVHIDKLADLYALDHGFTAHCDTCGSIYPEHRDVEVPDLDDGSGWSELARLHTPDCPWVRTRGYRLDPDESD